ncbi:DUF6009 family protein [Streptomyces kebangsaanensis]|uniref:DUF6009 family protein n=1 Tax=Streptomyces kebangsaanensis TaxID=864058 RepID=A0ABW6KLC6_9ACTN
MSSASSSGGFWVKEHDRSEQPNGIYRCSAPTKAVDPRTVVPEVWGELAERAWAAAPQSVEASG